MLHVYSLAAAASKGWETTGNTLTVYTGGDVYSVQIAGETEPVPVAPIVVQVIDDVKVVDAVTSQKFGPIAAILQDAVDGKKFMGFVTAPAQTEAFESDPEQDEEDVCLSTILHHFP